VIAFRPPAELPVYAAQRVAKGAADECFDGVGVDYPARNHDGSCPQVGLDPFTRFARNLVGHHDLAAVARARNSSTRP
jgi:hypothetical protein